MSRGELVARHDMIDHVEEHNRTISGYPILRWRGLSGMQTKSLNVLGDPRVGVSFQRKAWVDTETNIYGLKYSAKSVHDALLARGVKRGIQFENNLSSRITAEELACWKEYLHTWQGNKHVQHYPGTTLRNKDNNLQVQIAHPTPATLTETLQGS
eukprot:g9427.t1